METLPKYQRKMPDEVRQKISQTMKRKNMRRSPETRRKISNSLRRTWSMVQPPKEGGSWPD